MTNAPMKHFTLLLLWCVVSVRAETPPEAEALELAGSVHVIFDRKCNECHGSHLKKPEGKFGSVLDLKSMADNIDYIVPGKPEDSDLFRMVRDEEMPPDDHPKTPPLTVAEKALVRRWISAGAPSALPAILPILPEEPLPQPVGSALAADAKDRAMTVKVSLRLINRPASEAFAEIATQTGIPVTYAKPEREPQLSIQLKNGTAFEALNYLALCGNLSLRFTTKAAIIGPNPPPTPKEAK
jgi:hypothetical protein